MLNTKEEFLKNFEEPNSCWSPLTSIVGKEMQVSGDDQLLPAFLNIYIYYFMFNIRKKEKKTHTGLE